MSRHVYFSFPFAALCSWGIAFGCGSSNTAGGIATDGGARDDASLDAGATEDPRRPDADAACADRAKAYCDKLFACFDAVVVSTYGDVTRCAERQKLACVPAILATGSTTTAGDVRACAAALPGATCEDLFTLHAPPVACRPKAGSGAGGATCAFDSQCATSRCNEAGGCGSCTTRSSEGKDCRITDDCEYGLTCAASSKCRALVAVGAACSDDAPCKPPAGCLQSQCVAALEQGDVCDPLVDLCDPYRALSCEPIGKRCARVKFLPPGADCAGYFPGSARCATSSVCKKSDTTSRCLAAAADGELCDASAGPLCMAPAICSQGHCLVVDENTCH